MAEAALSFFVDRLKHVMVKKYMIWRSAKDLNLLKNDLELLKAFLKDSSAKNNNKKKDHLLRVLEMRIRDVVNDVEEASHGFSIKPASYDFFDLFKFKSLNLAEQVKSIRQEKVLPLFEYANAIANGSGDGNILPLSQRGFMQDKTINKRRVVGFEDEERTITGYLMVKTDNLEVLSIVGIPGQGKTTLAWKVYQSEEIHDNFPIRIWVSLSHLFNSRDVFLQILKTFSPSHYTSCLMDGELAQVVRSCLEKERFLLVLDDVSSVLAWKEIKEGLPENNGEGKVLITSREQVVGLQTRVYRDPHNLRFLDNDESLKLLQYEVFGELENCQQDLVGYMYDIAIKCRGVPLAIVVIGTILAEKLTNLSQLTTVSKWKMVADNVIDALQNDEEQRIIEAVALSYHRLPDDMRECFIFLGVFPEDYEIETKMLCRLWISEGFILPKNGGQSSEESAEENLNDLIQRNMLMVVRTNHMGKVKVCRVHYMIRAFCIAKSKEANLFHEVNRLNTGVFDPSLLELQKCQRLCFRSDLSKFLSESPTAPHVRSFLCFYNRLIELEPQRITAISGGFPNIRILEANCIKFHHFPGKITELIHLRYLTLNIHTLTAIPKSIIKLWNLQCLVVETKSRTIILKANIWEMIRLRYLKSNAAIILDSKWEGDGGEDLHTLNRLSPESFTEIITKKATNLRTLGISGDVAIIFESKFLEKLHHLEKLKLLNSLAYKQTHEDMLHGFPQGNCFPPNLKRLTLTNTFFNCRRMSTLAMIKSLEVLKLRDNAIVGLSWNLGRDNFPSLQLLEIVNITELVSLEASDDAFPKLRFLVVKFCENLNEIPECLETHLEKLEVMYVPVSVVESARKIGEKKKEKSNGKFGVEFKLTIYPPS